MTSGKRSQSKKRHRGYFLTPTGAEKLKNRIAALEQQTGMTYNPPKIAERTQLMGSQGLHPTTVRKILRGGNADETSLRLIFQAVELTLEEQDYTQPGVEEFVAVRSNCDWGEAVDVSTFYGRQSELEGIERWIVGDRCRLVMLLGMGGIGKTSLSVKFAERIRGEFEFVAWRSLLHAPPLPELLLPLVQFFSGNSHAAPKTVKGVLSQLMAALRTARCLLVFDNVEAILQPGSPAGRYREGYEDYGELLRQVAATAHQSCLVLTSRERPQGLAAFEGELLPVRSWYLRGLTETEAENILDRKGIQGSSGEKRSLVQLYQGNPLALKIVATSIQDLFAGNAAEFLAQGTAVFNGIRNLLAQQFERLSSLEREILYWLALAREPLSASQLREEIVPRVAGGRILEALEFAAARSLLETLATPQGQQFTLQPVVMEYVSDRAIEEVVREIAAAIAAKDANALQFCRRAAIYQANARDCTRSTQRHLILAPIIEELLSRFGSREALATGIFDLLARLRGERSITPGYAAGNLLNLLVSLQIDLSGCDFSGLTLWQADLRGTNLRRSSFARANLAKVAWSEMFGNIYSLALNNNGTQLATGHLNGEIRWWRVADGQLLLRGMGHHSTVWSLAWSPLNASVVRGETPAEMLASASFDRTIGLWDSSGEQPRTILRDHQDWVWGAAFAPDGRMLASCSSDRAIKLWDLTGQQCIATLEGHGDSVTAIAFSPDGKLLASGSADRTVRLWDVAARTCCCILRGHGDRIGAIAFSPDGQTLATSAIQQIKLWNIQRGKCQQTISEGIVMAGAIAFCPRNDLLVVGDAKAVKRWNLKTQQWEQPLSGFDGQVWSVVYSADGRILAASDKQMVRLWQISPTEESPSSSFNPTEYPILQTLRGYANSVCSVAWSPNGQTLASGGTDGTVSLWDMGNLCCLGTHQQHQNAIRTLAWSPDGKTLASGGEDGAIAFLELETASKHSLVGRFRERIWSVAFRADGQMLASGSADGTLRLWEEGANRRPRILCDRDSWIVSVAFSPVPLSPDSGREGYLLASSSDRALQLWDVSTGECLRTLVGHQGAVCSVAFSPDGKRLASASEDCSVKVWNVETGECCLTLQGHENWVWSVVFSPHGNLLASASLDRTLRLWDGTTGECLKILAGHAGAIWSVAFSPDGTLLASGSYDETLKLWDVEAGTCRTTLKPERLYEGMDLTEATGLTEAQKASLKLLGAASDREYSP